MASVTWAPRVAEGAAICDLHLRRWDSIRRGSCGHPGDSRAGHGPCATKQYSHKVPKKPADDKNSSRKVNNESGPFTSGRIRLKRRDGVSSDFILPVLRRRDSVHRANLGEREASGSPDVFVIPSNVTRVPVARREGSGRRHFAVLVRWIRGCPEATRSRGFLLARHGRPEAMPA